MNSRRGTMHFLPGDRHPGEHHSGSSQGLELGRVLRILGRRWWLVALSVGVVSGAAWYLVPVDRVAYVATAVVRMQDPTPRLTGGLVGPFGESVQSSDFIISQMHVIRSRTVLGEVVDENGLRLLPLEDLPFGYLQGISISDPAGVDRIDLTFSATEYAARTATAQSRAPYGEPVELSGVRFTLLRPPQQPTAAITVLSREIAIDRVNAAMAPRQRERSAVIDIVYRDPDPVRATVTANGITRSFQRHNSQGVREASRRRREFIEEQSLQSEVALARALQELEDFRGRTARIDRGRSDAERSELVALETQRDQLQSEFRLYGNFLDRVEQQRGERIDEELRTLMAAIGTAASPLLTQLYDQFADYSSQREQHLAGGRSPTHPDVQRLTTLIGSTRASVVDAARTQLASVSLRISAVEDQRSRMTAALQAIPDFSMDESRLLREVELAQDGLQALRGEYQRARMAEMVELGQVEVLDYALAAAPQIVGRRSRALMVAFLLSLFAGTGGALLLETLDSRVRRRHDAEALMAAPPLAVIPPVGGPYNQRRFGAARLLGGASTPMLNRGNGVISGAEFQSIASDAYRLLRTNLIFIDRTESLRTLVVTSSLAGEGKTTTAANLAIAFAREGRRVLLIDGDLRRPRLHHLFETNGGPGFTDILMGRVNRDAFPPASPMEGLDFVPRGPFDEGALERLTGPRMKELMASVREIYDLVIFDTPPVLLAAEAASLAAIADGVLLVVRAGSTRRQDVRSAVQQLNAVGGRLVGFVLNDPDSVAAREGEYGYEKYYTATE